jgi:hypothetical protein
MEHTQVEGRTENELWDILYITFFTCEINGFSVMTVINMYESIEIYYVLDKNTI